MESLDELILRCPGLVECRESIDRAVGMLTELYRRGGTLYICGNGGSSADSDHIVGELMKGFLKKRPIPAEDREKLISGVENGEYIAEKLQCGLRAVSLHSQSALLTAYANDVDASLIYAQTLYSLAGRGDVLLAISTSGNSANVVNAAKVAGCIGVGVISLTGERESKLSALSDVCIRVAETETYRVQELHLPVYHYICAKLEDEFFSE